jgi:AraC family transcriptional regulator of arabinose operon
MVSRSETPPRKVSTLVTGRYAENAGYSVWRTAGTRDWLLIHTLAGRGRFGFDGGELNAIPGDTVLLRPGARHDYGVEPVEASWELVWAHFQPRPAWMELLDWPQQAPGLFCLRLGNRSRAAEIADRLLATHARASGALRRGEDLAMNALEEVLLWCDALNPRSEQARVDERLQAVMDHVCLHLGEEMRLAHLARIGDLSESRLSHLFKEQMGCSPLQFVELQRVNRAKQLLAVTSKSVKQIAFELGYASPFYFSLRFKRATGESPSAYRQGLP